MTIARCSSRTLLLALAIIVIPVAAMAQSATPRSGSPRRLVPHAVEVMGGEAALRALSSTSADFYTLSFSIGQEEWLEGITPATVTTGTVVQDYATGGWRSATRSEQRQSASRTARQRRVTLSDGGMQEINGAQAALDAGALAAARRAVRVLPDRILLAALDMPSALTPLGRRRIHGREVEGTRYASGEDTLSLWFDGPTGLLLATETRAADPILGQRITTTTFAQYRVVARAAAEQGGIARGGGEGGGAGRLRLPHLIETTVNGRLASLITLWNDPRERLGGRQYVRHR